MSKIIVFFYLLEIFGETSSDKWLLGDIGVKLFNGHKFGVLDKYCEIQYRIFRDFYQKSWKFVLECFYNLEAYKKKSNQTKTCSNLHPWNFWL